ncbi:MAG: hypothetical protein AAB427_11685 [Chloroflexota bacterium]
MFFFLVLLQAALALITSPAEGQSIAGIVNITGTATGPGFARYEVAFAYEPNPTDSWFEMQPPSAAQVASGTLAVWDTRSISDGVYVIRLRVYSTDSGSPVETIVHRVIVQNAAPTDAPPTPPTLAPTSAPLLPSLAAPLSTLQSTPTLPHPQTSSLSLDLSLFTSAFCSGIYITFGIFLILGIYAALRDKIRRPIRRWLRRVLSDIRKP